MTPAQCDRDTFVQNLQQSGLLRPHEFSRAMTVLPETDRGRVAARALVDRGIITKFQAELLLVGRTHGFFLGQYKILDQLGQGGMGRVYKALHQPMKRVVALKVLAPQLVQTSKAMKLFKREVRAAAQLHHANIVTAYDANQINGRHYLVMEYVDGPNLDQLVRRRGPLPVGLACEIICQAACGLQYAHEMGLVHRDIKPANFLVQRPKRNSPRLMVKVTDFGLARLHEPLAAPDAAGRRENTIMGTPDFLSPEQSRNQPGVDIRSDIYSLGCTFYFLLTGRVPFPGGTTLEKLLRHSTEAPTTVELFRSDVPAPVLAALKKMFAKKPEDRFSVPVEVMEALAPFAAAKPTDVDMTASAKEADALPSLPNSGDVLERSPSDKITTEEEGLAGEEQSDQERADQVGTVPPDLAPTPFSDDILPPVWQESANGHRRQTLWLAVAIMLTLIGTVIGVALMVRHFQ